MFHKFSAKPAKVRSPTKRSGSARASDNNNTDKDSTPVVKRQRTARACDRCRQHRIKCDEQKPCAHCVGIKAKCTVSYPTSSTQHNNNDTDQTRPSALPRSNNSPNNGSGGRNTASSSVAANINLIRASVPPSRISRNQQSSREKRAPLGNAPKEYMYLGPHLEGFFASGQPDPSTFAGCIFPQLPHPAIPLEGGHLSSNPLLNSQRSYYLRLFWDVCHPLLQIMSEKEFIELVAFPPPTTNDEYSARSALVESMIAIGAQYSHVTGISGRILGLQQQFPRQRHHETPSPEVTWPGFDYFHRARECMRSNTEVTLDVLRCHTLLALYLMKGNAFYDAYNLLGITVRKAYIAKLHRLPPSHLPEAGKTARMQLWWMLFTLDIQCSLQLDMPTASQKSIVKCPFPTDDALARYFSSSHSEGGINAYTYTTHIAKLAIIVAEIGACVSMADLVEDSKNPAALETRALKLFSALHNLEAWHEQLPSDLLLNRRENGNGNTKILDIERDLSLPAWLQRQKVLLELHYCNACILIQRPFIRLAHSNNSVDMANALGPQQLHVEMHIFGALHHAIKTIDTVYDVCSKSDILYGWSEALQPLWNATLTTMAYIYANSLTAVAPQALNSLKRAEAVFESFSSTCRTARSAKGILESLANSLREIMAHASYTAANVDSMGWDFFASIEEQ